MIHPPTFYEGPLRDHETAELADLLELVGAELHHAGAEDLAGHVAWWIRRLTNVGKKTR